MPPTVTVVGLGPAGPDLLTAATLGAIADAEHRFLRTERHPAASAAQPATTFDHHYETHETIEAVYAAIVEDLVAAASAHGRVLYAVPGSPAVAERTVELLRADPRVETDILPALSCLDLAWARLGIDPLAVSPGIVDGHDFATTAAGHHTPLLVLQCDRPDLLADIKLATDDPPDSVTVLHHLGLPDERITPVPWNDLDRVQPDHLTSLWIPGPANVGAELVRFDSLVRTLRRECPWDAKQTHATLRPYLVEEVYEVIDAIDAEDADALEEELGDLLFQVYFHATLAAEDGTFTLADVARGIHDKLYQRHPHVFGGTQRSWEELKQEEKQRDSVLDGVPSHLPALQRAQKIQKRAAGIGFDWPDVGGAWPKVDEEIAELKAADPDERAGELGDLLFAVVNVARHLGIDAESALRTAIRKFEARFRHVEANAPPTATLTELDALWEAAKDQVDS